MDNTSTDKNDNTIFNGDIVITPEPNDSDIHEHSFRGIVIDIYTNGNCVIEDSDGDCFEIEGNRLELDNDALYNAIINGMF